jgi:hypothetical protein
MPLQCSCKHHNYCKFTKNDSWKLSKVLSSSRFGLVIYPCKISSVNLIMFMRYKKEKELAEIDVNSTFVLCANACTMHLNFPLFLLGKKISPKVLESAPEILQGWRVCTVAEKEPP